MRKPITFRNSAVIFHPTVTQIILGAIATIVFIFVDVNVGMWAQQFYQAHEQRFSIISSWSQL
jgi:hypothetical protein